MKNLQTGVAGFGRMRMQTASAERFPVDLDLDRFPVVRMGESDPIPFGFMDNAGGAPIPDSALDEVR